MKTVSAAQMRELDRMTIEMAGVPGTTLMDRAGRGVADIVLSVTRMSGGGAPNTYLFAGRGNNGGDVFAAARHLKEEGAAVRVWMAGAESDVRGDAFWHLSKMKEAGIELNAVPTKDDWESLDFDQDGEVLVDGILGIGTRGPARGPAVGAIQMINNLSDGRLVVAIDIPSGLDADTGEAIGDTVRADVTVTMGLPKKGLATAAAMDFVGSLEVVDIGIPAEYVAETPSDLELITHGDLRPLFQRRGAHSHKGTFGHLLIVAGSASLSGAAAMAARAAARAGAGLVTLAVPESIFSVVAPAVPEAMVHGLAETADGRLAADALDGWGHALDGFTAVLAGPGMTASDSTFASVELLLERTSVPMVLDADALNVLPGRAEMLRAHGERLILTPHPGEMARLLECDTDEIQGDRMASALRAAEVTGATVVLKGAGSIVVAPGRTPWVNVTGNPGMATGGMGDVLAGVLGGLLAQGQKPFDAARAAVYVHGHAGDSAAWRTSQTGLIASDVIEELAYAFRAVTPR
ncbi:MAG: NAD(P)H-hydrate dehydratase [Verrucomicrobia bacterium]|nr:NAD(P)H-hydrate dehydratase [Verrucomicrobiota bacterium]